LGTVIAPIQITSEIADDIATALRSSEADGEQRRQSTIRQLERHRHDVTSKLDRGFDDFTSGKISEEFWTRKSQEWEAELQNVQSEHAKIEQPQPCVLTRAQKILELAKQAEFLYKSQKPAEQRRLLETVLSNCTFDRGTLSHTYSKPFDLLVRGNETGEWWGRRDSNRGSRLFGA
jgi:hypothetical protein